MLPGFGGFFEEQTDGEYQRTSKAADHFNKVKRKGEMRTGHTVLRIERLSLQLDSDQTRPEPQIIRRHDRITLAVAGQTEIVFGAEDTERK